MNAGRIQRVVLPGVFLCLILVNVYKNRSLFTDPDQPYDARNVYLAGTLWSRGQNPYNDSLLKAEWQVTTVQNAFNSRKAPGFPDCGMIYPVWSIPMLFPYYIIPWSALYKKLILLLGLVCLLAVGYFYRSSLPELPVHPTWILAILLSYKSTVTALLLGQPMLPALAALSGSWMFYRKDRPLLAGLFLGLAMMKVTLCIPLIIFYLIRGKYKVLFVSAIIPLFSGLVFFLVSGDLYLAEMLGNMQTQMELNYPGHRINAVNTSLTEVGILFNYALEMPYAIIARGQTILLLILVAALWLLNRRRPFDEHWLISCLVLISLLLNYHLVYDGLILLVMIPLVIRSGIKWVWALFLAPLFLPVNGLFRGTDWVQFHLPVALIFLFLLTIYEYRNNHPAAITPTVR